jgi:DNA mismatch repair protein MutS
MTDVKITPMLEQYFQIKSQVDDAILFFRVGDFYETFFEDAELCSRELDIVLTSRAGSSQKGYPLAGVPYHAADSYIAKLVGKGYKVAICEQMESRPSGDSKIVERSVTRVVTPGTVLDSMMLDEKKNNYLISVACDEVSCTLIATDFSVGTMELFDFSERERFQFAIAEIEAFEPSEIIYCSHGLPESFEKYLFKYKCSKFNDVEPASMPEQIASQLKVSLDNGIGVALQSNLNLLLNYLKKMQNEKMPHLRIIVKNNENHHLKIDFATKRNLELLNPLVFDGSKGKSLLSVLDFTKTPMGGRQLRKSINNPLSDHTSIVNRLELVEELVNNQLRRHQLTEYIAKVRDVERIAVRVALMKASPRDLWVLAISLGAIAFLKTMFSSTDMPKITHRLERLDPLKELANKLSLALVDNAASNTRDAGFIRSAYNAELDALRHLCSDSKRCIIALEVKEREKTGIKSLKIGYNRVFGYYIEMTKMHSQKVPAEYVRKQTLANSERYINDELKQLEANIACAEQRAIALELEIFDDLIISCQEKLSALFANAEIIGFVDVLLSLSLAAVEYDYVRPEMHAKSFLTIIDGRHPIVERMRNTELFVPNSIHLTDERRLAILTGPNMAGKSTFIRQIALIVIMAHIGSFVPARSANIGLVDRVFARVGASDDLASGRSTFMMEMSEMSNIIQLATDRSLIILDEVGRGTSTYDGLSIAQAMIEYLHNKVCAMTVFATHYHELTSLSETLKQSFNICMSIKEKSNSIVFLRRVIDGTADKSYGIHVAELAGIPDEITARAKILLNKFESDVVQSTRTQKKQASKHQDLQQMSLLPEFDWMFINELRKLDLETITPLEAINFLFEWKNTLNQGSNDE